MSKTPPPFRRGETLYLAERISGMDWALRIVVVNGCGPKRMILSDRNTGAVIGRTFKPTGWQEGFLPDGPPTTLVFPARHWENATAIVRAAADSVRDYELTRGIARAGAPLNFHVEDRTGRK